MPSKTLIDELGLSCPSGEKVGQWVDANSNLVFIDPSVEERGPSYALIRTDVLMSWLEKQGLQLVWLVGGEKDLFANESSKFYVRLVFSGAYLLTLDGPKENRWFMKEEPNENYEVS